MLCTVWVSLLNERKAAAWHCFGELNGPLWEIYEKIDLLLDLCIDRFLTLWQFSFIKETSEGILCYIYEHIYSHWA